MNIRMKKKYQILLSLVVLVIIIAQGVYSDIPIDQLKADYANEHSRFMDVNGLKVHYRDEGNGFPIVLVHGTAASLHTWEDWTKELSKNYRVIRMDLPAFGLTGPNKTGDYSIKSYTKFLNDFTTKIRLDSFHLVGNSLGGNIAWNYALENPKKVKDLILVDASGLPMEKSKPWVFKMARTPILNQLFLYYTPRFFIKKNIQQVYHDDSKITDELITRYHRIALGEGNRQAFIDRAQLDATEDSLSSIEKLQKIKNRTLLIWGAKDQWIPLSHGKVMHTHIANSTLRILENSGHVPMEENPNESLTIVNEFLISE